MYNCARTSRHRPRSQSGAGTARAQLSGLLVWSVELGRELCDDDLVKSPGWVGGVGGVGQAQRVPSQRLLMQLEESYVHCLQAGRPPPCCPDALLQQPNTQQRPFWTVSSAYSATASSAPTMPTSMIFSYLFGLNKWVWYEFASPEQRSTLHRDRGLNQEASW